MWVSIPFSKQKFFSRFATRFGHYAHTLPYAHCPREVVTLGRGLVRVHRHTRGRLSRLHSTTRLRGFEIRILNGGNRLAKVLGRVNSLSTRREPGVNRLTGRIHTDVRTVLGRGATRLEDGRRRTGLGGRAVSIALPNGGRRVNRGRPLSVILSRIGSVFINVNFRVTANPRIR